MDKDVKNELIKIPASIWILGFVSLLMDISSEIIHSLLPVFLVSVLGASALMVGIIEGFAESTALIVKIFSGTLSDYLGKRKLLAVAGYSLGALSKPLFAIATTIDVVFSARIIDRVGKGIRGAPRDALVADIAPLKVRGAAYGLRQSLDTVGAFSGPLLAIILMLLWTNNFRAIFWVAVIPGLLSVLLLIFGVQEPKDGINRGTVNPIQLYELKRLPSSYWWVILMGVLFSLARFSEAFLILRAQQGGLPVAWSPLVLVVMNLVYSLAAYPFGKLSDSENHFHLLGFGLIILILADLILGYSISLPFTFIGICLWGLHMGISQGLLARLVADTAPADLRGTAFGIFNLLSGVMILFANILAGFLWDRFSPSLTFLFGVIFCIFTLAVIFFKNYQSNNYT